MPKSTIRQVVYQQEVTSTDGGNVIMSSGNGSSQMLGNYSAPSKSKGIWADFESVDFQVTKLLAICAEERSPLFSLRPFFKVVELLGTGYITLTVPMAIALFLPKHSFSVRVTELVINIIVIQMLDLVVVGILKGLFRRSRPNIGKSDMVGVYAVDKFSFPSGHSTRASTLFCLAMSKLVLNRIERFVFMCYTILLCFSRIALGRHHVSDVFAGFGIGCVQYFAYSFYWISPVTCQEILKLLHWNMY